MHRATAILRLFAAVVAIPIAASSATGAQEYPTRPITLIVPYTAGGGNDLLARAAADKMSKTLGQHIVIENRGGAGGSIATRAIAKAEPDGYTLGLGGTGTLAINPTLYPNVGYDPRKDFAPVGLIAASALVICLDPSLPVRSVADLIALAKREPSKINYASAGTGSGIHLATEYFAAMAGIKLTHIPYKGAAPALTDVIGGHVAFYFSSMPAAVGLVKDGKVRALAGTALPGYEAVLHYGIVGPAGTPRPIIEKLSAALRAALTSDEVRARIADDGAEPVGSTPEEYAADIDREETKWSAIVKLSGARAE
jgi:tripartite-type tricarboxylate transporter receptor subunit TctC